MPILYLPERACGKKRERGPGREGESYTMARMKGGAQRRARMRKAKEKRRAEEYAAQEKKEKEGHKRNQSQARKRMNTDICLA